MKNILLSCFLIGSMLATGQTKTYQLETNASVINWRGYYAFKFSEHTGTVVFRSGELYAKNGDVTGGNFIVEMDSMTNEDYESSGNGPVQHLKDPDFFDVKKHPIATLEITSVEYFPEDNIHKMMADLTIKGITKEVEFWATIDGDTGQMTTKFKIDRIRWGITHNNDMRDHAIADAIEFDVFLQFVMD